jgi:Tfp pilus assembly protein PilE
MYCSHCGVRMEGDLRFCPACGAPKPSPLPPPSGAETAAPPLERVRPPLIALLAVIKLLSGLVWLVLGVAFVAFSNHSPDGRFALPLAGLAFVFGALALVGGYGLWTLRAYGRYVQMGFSFLGLLGFPIQTVISILILVYMFNPGIKVLFSEAPVDTLGEVDRERLRSLRTANATAVVVAIAVAIPVMLFVGGILAAIAIPNFLNAVDRGKQKRTMADLRSIGSAVETYAVDHREYPTATTAAELEAALEPDYIRSMPAVDGWGHALEVNSTSTHYALLSHGKDGTGDDCEPAQTVRFNDEICFVDGEFIRYPQGSQR